jgi:hypothetical protein
VPVRAIHQADKTNLGPALLAQAIDHGERNGRLTLKQAQQLREEIGLPPSGGARR